MPEEQDQFSIGYISFKVNDRGQHVVMQRHGIDQIGRLTYLNNSVVREYYGDHGQAVYKMLTALATCDYRQACLEVIDLAGKFGLELCTDHEVIELRELCLTMADTIESAYPGSARYIRDRVKATDHVTECANCNTEQVCFDDREAYVCTNTEACKLRQELRAVRVECERGFAKLADDLENQKHLIAAVANSVSM